jgi:hypothetical protein
MEVLCSRPDRSGNGIPSDKHEARLEELTGLREFGRDAPGVENGRLLVGMLVSGSVQRQAVFVDDMKEVSHAAELGRSIAGFQ